MANKIVQLKDNQDNVFLANNIYSTSETRIGTWIDGRPLYRKVLHVTTAGTFPHGITNIRTITHIWGRGLDGNNAYPVPYTFVGRDLKAYVYANSSTFTIGVQDLGTAEFFICLEYTKTTD